MILSELALFYSRLLRKLTKLEDKYRRLDNMCSAVTDVD